MDLERWEKLKEETFSRITAMDEEGLKDYADKNCKKCLGIGRTAYRVIATERKVIICNCVVKNVKKSVEEGMDAESSK